MTCVLSVCSMPLMRHTLLVLLGDPVNESGFSLTMLLHTSAGRYICGEETALINSLEGQARTATL